VAPKKEGNFHLCGESDGKKAKARKEENARKLLGQLQTDHVRITCREKKTSSIFCLHGGRMGQSAGSGEIHDHPS